MCELSTIALGLSVAGGLFSAQQQSAIGEANAQVAEYQAAQAREIGLFKEGRARDRMDRLIGVQAGQVASRGARLDSLTSGMMAEEAGEERALEGMAHRFNTAQQVSGLTNEAALSRSRGELGFMSGVFDTGARALSGSLDLWPELGDAWP